MILECNHVYIRQKEIIESLPNNFVLIFILNFLNAVVLVTLVVEENKE
jgi:hypothetical protein